MKHWLLLAGMLVGAAWPASPGVAQGLFDDLISPEMESQIGAEQHEQVISEFGGVYDNPALAAYVDGIGQFLALTSERPGFQYRFTILNTPMVNAFALPGGYVYVTRGLLALADSEAELAGVIAHEIGHVAAGHGRDRMGNSALANLGLAVLGAITDNPEIAQLAQVGAAALITSYSREDEFDADLLGVRYLTRAGFSPAAMSSFLAKLEAESAFQSAIRGADGDQFNIMSTHPRTRERVERAIQVANVTFVSNPIVARDIYLNQIDGMLYGDDIEQGVVRGRRFIHPELGIAFEVPESFNLINGTKMVVAHGPDESMIRFDGGPRPENLPLANYLREHWLKGAPLGEIQPVQINGLKGATAAFRTSANGRQVDIRVVAISYEPTVVVRFTFVTLPQYTQSHDLEFRETAYSFRRVSRSEIAAVTPYRLQVYRVRAGDTPASLAARLPFADHKEERFRLLNGLAPGQLPPVGTRIKMVVDEPRY